eukprot:CAMPEP_0182461900 /NCGR_PEP_ID=MMETSP1319-20130603/6348_1 /TAXON_ID=172717 /ORGANISM="Bolidomonas pacifica, Strain RCC208" /LENGTH=71 /DNA_ID=CAMNT_0024661255 /DNA_START=17 /DNA_END=232 /DNA_ORIENTATION=-
MTVKADINAGKHPASLGNGVKSSNFTVETGHPAAVCQPGFSAYYDLSSSRVRIGSLVAAGALVAAFKLLRH